MVKKRRRVRSNGEGGIIHLSGKRKRPYAVRITVGKSKNGRQIFKYLSYHTKISDARASLREYLVNPYDIEKKNVTLKEVYYRFMSNNRLSSNTMKNYKSAFNKCYALHDKPIKSIKIDHIEEIINDLSPSTQKTFKSVLNKVFKYAIQHDILQKNIIEFLSVDQINSKPRIPFTISEIFKIMEYNSHPFSYTIKILLYTGLRISELLELKTEDICLDEDYMVGGKKNKFGKNRIFPIHKEIKHLIKSIFDIKNKYLIVNKKGNRISYRYYMIYCWNKIKEDIGFKQTPHSTRHTFITYSLRCGSNRDIIQKIVGHKGDMTDRYNHVTLEHLKYEINKLKYI